MTFEKGTRNRYEELLNRIKDQLLERFYEKDGEKRGFDDLELSIALDIIDRNRFQLFTLSPDWDFQEDSFDIIEHFADIANGAIMAINRVYNIRNKILEDMRKDHASSYELDESNIEFWKEQTNKFLEFMGGEGFNLDLISDKDLLEDYEGHTPFDYALEEWQASLV